MADETPKIDPLILAQLHQLQVDAWDYEKAQLSSGVRAELERVEKMQVEMAMAMQRVHIETDVRELEQAAGYVRANVAEFAHVWRWYRDMRVRIMSLSTRGFTVKLEKEGSDEG